MKYKRNLQNNKIQRNKFGMLHIWPCQYVRSMLLQNLLPGIGLSDILFDGNRNKYVRIIRI